MTPQEFKAWFDGFTEAFTGCPTKAQWTRIKARVAEIDGQPVTERIYVDRYWPTIYPVYQTYPRYFTTYCSGVSGSPSNVALQNAVGFNSLDAMTDLGRVEASNIAGA